MSALFKLADDDYVDLTSVRGNAGKGALLMGGLGAAGNAARQYSKNKEKDEEDQGSVLGAAAKGGTAGAVAGGIAGGARGALNKFKELSMDVPEEHFDGDSMRDFAEYTDYISEVEENHLDNDYTLGDYAGNAEKVQDAYRNAEGTSDFGESEFDGLDLDPEGIFGESPPDADDAFPWEVV